jgi:DNA-directed RNA polymerase subunit RPC12/RpoP
MELKTVRVKQRALTCRTCEIDFFGYSETADSEIKLYECADCGTLFALPNGVSLEAAIKGAFCPDCNAPLEESLEEKTAAGTCPMCEGQDYYGSGDPEEVELEIYGLDGAS